MFITKKKLEEMIDEKLENLERRSNDKLKRNRVTVENWTSVMVRLLITDFVIGVLKENDYEITSDIESKIKWYISELNSNVRLSVVEYTLQFSEIVKIQTTDNKRIEIRYFENHHCIDSYDYLYNGYHNKIIKIDIPNDMVSTNDYKEGDK